MQHSVDPYGVDQLEVEGGNVVSPLLLDLRLVFVFEVVLDGYYRIDVFTSPLIRPHEHGTPGYFLVKSRVDSLSDNKGFANDQFGAVLGPPVCQSAVTVLLYSQLKREHSWPLKCMQ